MFVPAVGWQKGRSEMCAASPECARCVLADDSWSDVCLEEQQPVHGHWARPNIGERWPCSMLKCPAHQSAHTRCGQRPVACDFVANLGQMGITPLMGAGARSSAIGECADLASQLWRESEGAQADRESPFGRARPSPASLSQAARFRARPLSSHLGTGAYKS